MQVYLKATTSKAELLKTNKLFHSNAIRTSASPDDSESVASGIVPTDANGAFVVLKRLRSLHTRDQRYKISFMESKRPTLRYTMISSQLTTFTMFFTLLASIEYILYQTDSNTYHSQCIWFEKIPANCSSISWILCQSSLMMRAFAFLGNTSLERMIGKPRTYDKLRTLFRFTLIILIINAFIVFPISLAYGNLAFIEQTKHLSACDININMAFQILAVTGQLTLYVLSNAVNGYIFSTLISSAVENLATSPSKGRKIAALKNTIQQVQRTTAYGTVLSFVLIVGAIVSSLMCDSIIMANDIPILLILVEHVVCTCSSILGQGSWKLFIFPYYAMHLDYQKRKNDEDQLEMQMKLMKPQAISKSSKKVCL